MSNPTTTRPRLLSPGELDKIARKRYAFVTHPPRYTSGGLLWSSWLVDQHQTKDGKRWTLLCSPYPRKLDGHSADQPPALVPGMAPESLSSISGNAPCWSATVHLAGELGCDTHKVHKVEVPGPHHKVSESYGHSLTMVPRLPSPGPRCFTTLPESPHVLTNIRFRTGQDTYLTTSAPRGSNSTAFSQTLSTNENEEMFAEASDEQETKEDELVHQEPPQDSQNQETRATNDSLAKERTCLSRQTPIPALTPVPPNNNNNKARAKSGERGKARGGKKK